jgi:undecaprenyl-diphosphatase
VFELDRQVLFWINGHHNIILDAILAPVAFAGEGGAIWILVCLYLLIVGKPGYRRTAIILLITMIAVDKLIAGPVGLLFDRPRPYVDVEGIRQLGVRWTSGSFPSGHAHSVCVAAIILANQWRKLTIPLVIFAILTCYSRPYFGMHYPIDTLAGALIGIIAGFSVVGVDKLIQLRKKVELE